MGVRSWLLLVLVLWLGLLGCRSAASRATARGALPEDPKAESFYALGEKLFHTRNYLDAAHAFEQAALRNFNRLTTASIYMAGLAYTYSGDAERAIAHFQNLIKNYPKSTYLEEANYHKALLMLQDGAKQEGGLFVLLNLLESVKSSSLRQDGQAALHQFLYERASLDFLKNYLAIVRPAFEGAVTEALAYRYYHAQNKQALKQLLTNYTQKGNSLTDNLRKLATPQDGASLASVELRIAVLLPLYSSRFDTTVSQQSYLGLELLEGMRLAAEVEKYPQLIKLNFLVCDTQNDSIITAKLLAQQVQLFHPDIIVGDVKNRTSRVIARFAAEVGALHLVPLSDSDELTQQQANTFLASPSQLTSARALAGVASKSAKLNTAIVFSDETKVSDRMAQEFTTTLQQQAPGCSIVRKPLPSTRVLAIDRIKSTLAAYKARKATVDVVYVPINNEELVSYSLFQLSHDSLEATVYGTDKWNAFPSLDRAQLERLHATVTDPYRPGNDSLGYLRFRDNYQRRYKTLPSTYAAQGYDIVRFLLSNCISGKGVEGVHQAKPFKGLCQNFYFASANNNQSVQIFRYEDGEVKRLTIW